MLVSRIKTTASVAPLPCGPSREFTARTAPSCPGRRCPSEPSAGPGFASHVAASRSWRVSAAGPGQASAIQTKGLPTPIFPVLLPGVTFLSRQKSGWGTCGHHPFIQAGFVVLFKKWHASWRLLGETPWQELHHVVTPSCMDFWKAEQQRVILGVDSSQGGPGRLL